MPVTNHTVSHSHAVPGKTAFFTPGGKREAGETDEEALIRECKEELTIDLATETIQPYSVFQVPSCVVLRGTVSTALL